MEIGTSTNRPDPLHPGRDGKSGLLCFWDCWSLFTNRSKQSESITKNKHSRRERKQGTPKPTLWKYRDAKSQTRHGNENRSLIEPLGIVAATRKAETWGGRSINCESKLSDIVSWPLYQTNTRFIGKVVSTKKAHDGV